LIYLAAFKASISIRLKKAFDTSTNIGPKYKTNPIKTGLKITQPVIHLTPSTKPQNVIRVALKP
jgi:hypothetical protein